MQAAQKERRSAVRERQRVSGDIREPAYGPSRPVFGPWACFPLHPRVGIRRVPESILIRLANTIDNARKWRPAVRERQTVTRRLHVT